MAKKSKIAKNEQRRLVVARHAERRAELKAISSSAQASDEERAAAQRELRRQPRDASATRVRNRDSVDGRPRGHLRAFGLSRIRLREMAHAGELPGVTKSSWWPSPRACDGDRPHGGAGVIPRWRSGASAPGSRRAGRRPGPTWSRAWSCAVTC